MKKAELIKVLVFLSNAYPRKFKFPLKTKRDNKEFIETWYDFLGDYDYLTVKNTAKKLIIRKTEWPPTLGEVVKEINRNQLKIF